MPHGAVVRIEEIIINVEHLAQHLTHGGCSVVSDRERCNFIMRNRAPTSPSTVHLIFPTHCALQPDLDFAVTLGLSEPLL